MSLQPPVTILNVDDTAALRYTKSRMLKHAGFDVIEASGGAEALRLVHEHKPQLVLLDVNLPDMSGLDVCRSIKGDPDTRSIPVVQISATFVTEQDQLMGLEGGAEIYLTEPIEAQELTTVVRTLLRLRAMEAEREEAFQRERNARLQAEEATRIKDEFLATLSHELRTPMNTIISWTHLLRTGRLDQIQHVRAIESIDRAAHSQAQLIEDLLDVSRIVSGKLHLTLRPVELEPLIESGMESQRPAAQTKGVSLNVHRSRDPITVVGDADRLQQVFLNLLSNAVKFTPAGGKVDVMLERAGAHARVSVADSGEGIAPGFLPYVFDRFRQADGTKTRTHMGLGLGLAIVRHIVELHGGTVQAQSAGAGLGATFMVTLPLAARAPAASKP